MPNGGCGCEVHGAVRVMPSIRAGAVVLAMAACLAVPAARGAPPREAGARDALQASIDAYAPRMARVAHEIWEHPELGCQENRASKLLQGELAEAGFEVQAGIGGMPTAVVASAGNGKGQVIALIAEMDALTGVSPTAVVVSAGNGIVREIALAADRDALPGDSPAAVPEHGQIAGQGAGHACGHNLFSAGSVAAALAVARSLQDTGRQGETRVYGTP